MRPTRRSGSDSDMFPGLSAAGLQIHDIKGDGNCLFRALSDQLYGHQNKHAEVRDKIITHIRANKAHFINFVSANDNRRSARRHRGSLVTGPVSQETLDARFEAQVKAMEQSGTWGDNVEVSASAAAFGVRVQLWTEQYQVFFPEEETDCAPASLPRIHIAFHSWGHYSSVRKIGTEHISILDSLPFSPLPTPSKKLFSKSPSTSSTSPHPSSNPISSPSPKSSAPKRKKRRRPGPRPLPSELPTPRHLRLRRQKRQSVNPPSDPLPSPSSYPSSTEYLDALQHYRQHRTLTLRQREDSLGMLSPVRLGSPGSSFFASASGEGEGWESRSSGAGTRGSSLEVERESKEEYQIAMRIAGMGE